MGVVCANACNASKLVKDDLPSCSLDLALSPGLALYSN